MKKKILALMMSTALLAGTYSSVWADGADYADGDVHTIGVVLYDPDSAEMEMFADYYRDYIQKGFPGKIYFSGKISDFEAEKAFIAEAKAEGIISFAGYADGLQDVIKPVKRTKSTMHLVPTQ